MLILILVGLIGLVIYVTVRQGPEISSVISAVSNLNFADVEPKKIITFKELAHYMGK